MTNTSKKILGEDIDRIIHRLVGRNHKCSVVGHFLFVIMYIITMTAFLILMINRIQPIPLNEGSRAVLESKSKPISSQPTQVIVLSSNTINNQTILHEKHVSITSETSILRSFPIKIRNSLSSFKNFLQKCLQSIYTSIIQRLIPGLQPKEKHENIAHSSQANHTRVFFPISYARKISRTDASPYDSPLSSTQLQLIENTYKSASLHEKAIESIAKQTKFLLTRYAVYQYYEASDWIGHYHSLP
jgi:hypothetical protein